jgi:plastocyanin
VPAVPPPPLEPLEPPAPEQTLVGLVSFFDTLAPSDSLNVLLNGLADPAGNELHARLTDSATGSVLELGRLQPDVNGSLVYNYVDPNHQNLLALYDGFQITQEPPFDDDPTPGPVLYSGQQATGALAAIRTITVNAADTPEGKAFALGARQQTEELLRHVEYVQLAFELLSIADAKRHSEHILNLLDGVGSDLDGAHGIQNPGDGFGVVPYVTRMREAAVAASEAADANGAIQLHASHVLLSSDNALAWAAQIREATVQIGQTASVGDIGPQVETITRFSNLLLNGEDGNGDGEVAPAEGGIFTAYQHSQYMAAIGVSTGVAVAGAEEHSEEHTPAPAAEAPADAAPGETVVRLLDFNFEPAELSIPPGTTVKFINAGQARHSATLDSNAFDSTLLEPGGEFSFTFNEPGTFPYYCLLHGLPGGEGMAGVITVTP